MSENKNYIGTKDGEKLSILDVSNLEQIKEIASISMNSVSYPISPDYGSSNYLVIRDNYNNVLKIYDLSNPANPRLVAEVDAENFLLGKDNKLFFYKSPVINIFELVKEE